MLPCILLTSLSERHPPKQGLKHRSGYGYYTVFYRLSERHPPKQGLKRADHSILFGLVRLSERHPPKQGLKPGSGWMLNHHGPGLSERHPPKQGLKQATLQRPCTAEVAFRATSTKTRIETIIAPREVELHGVFQSDIHQNKD